ncbi:MAG: thermopsin family protease [Nitrososphaerales archaeon]|jgi:thermopsin
MNPRSLVWALPLALLIVSSPIAAASVPRTTSAPLPYQLGLPASYYEPIEVDAPATQTTLTFAVVSNVSVSTALMTNAQETSFGNGQSDVSAALYLHNGSSAQDSVKLSEGVYYLVFVAYGSNANITYNVVTYPISPYYLYPLTAPEPSGIASFGLYNDSGKVSAYTVESSDVVGVADIASLQAFNSSAAQYNDTLSGATLQLNAGLVVNEKGGGQQVYWVQDTPDFVTNASVVSWADNIWNSSVSGYLSNSTITSPDGGYAYSFDNYGTTAYYYSYQGSNMTYALPLQLALVMSETATPGVGVLVQIGAQVIQNSSSPVQAVDWFDNATIKDATVQTASFDVTGNATMPNGLYYDTEFVFGGEGNGESTNFTHMSAQLGLFYGNSTGAPQTAYPSYYSFGGDTGETADNLQIAYAGNGFSTVSAGTPNYVFLGNASTVPGSASNPYSLPSAGSVATNSFTSSTASSSASSSQASTTSLSSTTTTTSSTSSGSSTSLASSYLIVVAAATSLVALAGLSARRVRDRRRFALGESGHPWAA